VADDLPSQKEGLKMNRSLIAVGLVALVAVCAPAVALGEATTSTTNVFVDETIPVENPCTGETIVFEIRAHFLVHSTADGAGGTHTVDLAHGQRVTGVSSTGTPYVGKIVGPIVGNDNGPNAQAEATSLFLFHVISRGGSDNFFLEVGVHTTTTAKGETAAAFEHFRAECRG
jgi:hypothetical protein